MSSELLQVEFASNRLDLIPGVDLYNHDFNQLPNREIKMNKLARRSLSIITSAEYTDKNVPIWADVNGGSRAGTEAVLKTLKALVQVQNGSLRVKQAGEWTEYTATLNEFNIEWDGPNAYCTLVFLASTPIGATVEAADLFSATGVTTSSRNLTFVNEGSYTAEPLITININSVTGGTGGTINLFNALTNQGITITGNFTAGDVLSVDSADYDVLLNGAKLDFTGLFPTFPTGTQQVAYSDTFTTRNVDITGTGKKRFV